MKTRNDSKISGQDGRPENETRFRRLAAAVLFSAAVAVPGLADGQYGLCWNTTDTRCGPDSYSYWGWIQNDECATTAYVWSNCSSVGADCYNGQLLVFCNGS